MFKTNWKPSRTARKKAEKKTKADRKKHELDNKAAVRRRDLYRCRFPLCGCHELRLPLKARREVSHSKHKGMGGNPAGDRSAIELMVVLCLHRHQDGAVSIHKGTLRPRFLTPAKFNGPIAWEADSSRLWPSAAERWIELARETAVQQWEPFTPKQQVILERLAEMQL